jgi:hypothetical protein
MPSFASTPRQTIRINVAGLKDFIHIFPQPFYYEGMARMWNSGLFPSNVEE